MSLNEADTRAKLIDSAIHKCGWTEDLIRREETAGTVEIINGKARVVVFVDGNFWHGYRFTSWENKMSDFCKKKISKNRERDARNHRKLREMG